MRSPLQLLPRQHREPGLDEIDPRGVGRREVHVEARMPGEPPPRFGSLVRRVVVQNDVDVEVGGHRFVDDPQELDELLRAVPSEALADDPPSCDIQGSEQRRRPVADVVVRPLLDGAGSQREHRLRPFEGLDLGLLVDTEHEGLVRRIHVQADDVPDLVDEERVVGELERLTPMRLQRERSPHAGDRALAQTGRVGHRSGRPVRGVLRLLLKRLGDHAFDILVGDLARRSGPRRVGEAIESLRGKSTAPLGHGRTRDPDDFGDLLA